MTTLTARRSRKHDTMARLLRGIGYRSMELSVSLFPFPSFPFLFFPFLFHKKNVIIRDIGRAQISKRSRDLPPVPNKKLNWEGIRRGVVCQIFFSPFFFRKKGRGEEGRKRLLWESQIEINFSYYNTRREDGIISCYVINFDEESARNRTCKNAFWTKFREIEIYIDGK